MRRSVGILSLLFFFHSSTLFSASISQNRQSQPVVLKPISDNLYEITGGRGANGGVYFGETGILVIDSKMSQDSVDQTLTEIKKISDLPIRFLVNTHSDGDHIAGNRFFPKSVTFIAHENCRRDFFQPQRNGEPSEWSNPDLYPFIPALTFQQKMMIYLGAKPVELYYFGIGHTTGDIVVYFPEEKTAFLGDQFFMGRPQLIHSYKGGHSFEHVKTLQRMLENLNAERFCSGHSEPVGRDVLLSHIEQMKQRQNKVKKLVEQGKSLEEVQAAFEKNEARLIESIYQEIKSSYRAMGFDITQPRILLASQAFLAGLTSLGAAYRS